MRPHGRQPTRLPRPWDSPGKNTGVGCHFLLQCMKVKSESEVAQSCPTPAIPWTAAHQAPPSMGFSRQEYWSRVPLPSPGDLPDPEIEPMSPMLQADALPSEPPEKLCLRVLHKTKTKVIATMISWLEVLVKKPHLCTSKLLAKFCFFALLRLMSSLVAVSWELLSTSRGCPHLFSQGASTLKLALAR